MESPLNNETPAVKNGFDDLFFMKAALNQAKKAYKIREVPVGAVVVHNNVIIARGYNQKEKRRSPLAHAEVSALQKGCKVLGNWRLSDCALYVTLEPCLMCTGVILETRIGKVVYAAENIRLGWLKKACEQNIMPAGFQLLSGVMAEESSQLLKKFFREERWLSSVESARLEIE